MQIASWNEHSSILVQPNAKNRNVKLAKTTVSIDSSFVGDSKLSFSTEERCEPSFPLFRNTGTRRFCPDIHNWKEFDNYEIGNGYEVRDPLNDETRSTTRKQYYPTTKNYDRYRRPTTTTPAFDNEDEMEPNNWSGTDRQGLNILIQRINNSFEKQ